VSEGLLIGKIETYNGVDLPREVLVGPLGLGTPGGGVRGSSSEPSSDVRRIREVKGPRGRLPRLRKYEQWWPS
jgi:hypothetical protein